MAAVGEGLSRMGDNGNKVVSRIEDARRRESAFQDDNSLAIYDRKMTEAFAQYQAKIAGTSESNWFPGWQEEAPKMHAEAMKGLEFSGDGEKRLSIAQQSFMGQTNRTLIGAASRSAVERGVGEQLAQVDRLFDRQDVEGAGSVLDNLVATGAIRRDQADDKLRQVKGKWQDDQLSAALSSNPKALREDLEKGDVAHFGDMPETKQRIWLDRAKRQARQNDQESYYDAQNGVASGELQTLEDVKRVFPEMEPRKLKLIERQFQSFRNFDPATDGPLFAEARAAIAAYDGSEDSNGAKADEIDDLISRLPKRQQGMLASAYQQAWASTWKDGKEKPLREKQLGFWMKEMESRGKSGFLGDTGRDPKKWDKVTDPAKSAAYGETLTRMQDELEAWSRKNGDASPEQFREAYSKIVGPTAAEQSAKAFEMQRNSSFGSNSYADQVTPFSRPASKKSKAELIEEADALLELPEPDLTLPVEEMK